MLHNRTVTSGCDPLPPRSFAPSRARAACLALVLALSLLAVPATFAGTDTPTVSNEWADFYSYHLTFAGVSAPSGTDVTAWAGTIQCGDRVTSTSTDGRLAPMLSCYGADSGTPGAADGDVITFKVNGAPATAIARAKNFSIVSSTTPIKWNDQDTWEIDVTASAQPQVSIGHATGQTTLAWQAAVVSPGTYEVWRSDHPYFNPVAGEATLIATVQATANPLAASDTQGAGNTGLNESYRVLSKGAGADATKLVGASQVVGEFDFGLVH